MLCVAFLILLCCSRVFMHCSTSSAVVAGARCACIKPDLLQHVCRGKVFSSWGRGATRGTVHAHDGAGLPKMAVVVVGGVQSMSHMMRCVHRIGTNLPSIVHAFHYRLHHHHHHCHWWYHWKGQHIMGTVRPPRLLAFGISIKVDTPPLSTTYDIQTKAP